MPEAPRPDWRNTNAKAPATPGTRPWKAQEGEAAGPKMPSRRFLRRAIVVACILGLAIGIGVLLSFLKGTRPACLVVVGSGYEHNLLLPHNVYGWNGSLEVLKNIGAEEETALMHWFRQQFGQKSGIRRTGPVSLGEDTWPDTWRKIDERIKKGDAKEQVILYFSAHGYADDNEAYLLRDVAEVKSPEDFNSSRIAFGEVLDSLKKDVPPEKGIVLILDVCHVQSHWPIGMLQNDFVERVQKKHAGAINSMENLTVICSTSPGQRSWAAEERQTTIFADHLSKGLRGEGRAEGDRITAAGLFDHVKKEVNAWAKANRAREQIPVRIGERDLDLSLVARPTPQQVKDDAPKEEQKKEEAPKANAGANFNPADLKPAWEAWLKLKRDYAPQVYAPHYWRLYQETLLRYEQLLRAGDPTGKADALKKKLDLLENDIKAAKALDKAFDCLGNSFPLPRVLGFRPQGDAAKELQAALAQWKLNGNDHQKLAASLKPFAGKPELERRYWQARLSKELLSAHLKQPDYDTAAISQDLGKIAADLTVPQRSAEAHFVKMLQDVDPALAKQPDLIKLAVSVRMLAEESALGAPDETASELYAEAIFKRLQSAIKDADKLRREGEDRLFGDPRAQAAGARAKLAMAQTEYEKIRAQARQLRQAFALRDDIAAELPFLAASLASLPPVSAQTQKEIEVMRTRAETLGTSLALLTKHLDKAEKSPALKPIEDDLNYVRAHYHTLCKTLRDLGTDELQMNWHALDGVLSIPPATSAEEVELRIALLKKLRDTSAKLEAAKLPDARKADVEDTVEPQRKLLRATLKPFEEQVAGGEAKNVDDSVRQFYLGQFKKTAEEAADAEKESALQSAAGRSRVLLGCLADQLKDQQGERINPAKGLRYLLTRQLLLGLAERTLDDHWFNPGAKDEPTYYGPVAKAYLAAARNLEPKGAKVFKQREELERRLAPIGLTIAGERDWYWTTELSFPLNFSVEADKGDPAGLPRGFVEGLPTVWFEVPRGTPKERETVRAWPTHFAASVLLNEADFAAPGKVPVTMHALYRGQHVIRDLNVERPPPNIIARHTPGPDKVGFAVRMDKVDYGAISIVLDNSGSMGTLHPRDGKDRQAKPGEKSRYDYAIKALEQVLQKLPEDTFLSISTFGGKEVTEPQFVEWPNNPSGKPYQRWQPGQLKNLLADLKGRSLNNYSPIAKAIIKSTEEGFPPDFRDPKLIVVLTDGMDNYSFDKDADKNAAARDRNTDQVVEALRKARKPGVEVVLVCFIEKEDEEYDHAKKQFLPIGEDNIIFESEGAKLGGIIENRLIRPHVQLKLNGKPAQGFDIGRPVNYLSDRTLSWQPSLNRNDYQAGMLNSSAAEFEVKMAPGHNLFAILKREENKFVLKRGVVGLQPEADKNNCMRERKGDWLVTLLKNEKPFGVDARSQLIAFEKTPAGSGPLRQIPPGFVWLELDGIGPAQTLEWGSDLVVPAPAYAVDVANWADGHPKLNAWFWPNSWDDLLKTVPPVLDQRINIKNHVSRPGDLIESVRWENRLVGVMTPKGSVLMKKDCLVIRARYLDGKPVYVGLKEQNERQRVGSEHRFFGSAGKSTACFYDLPAALEDVDVVVIPVERFKDAAVRGDTRVVFAPQESIAVPNIFRKDIIEAIHGK